MKTLPYMGIFLELMSILASGSYFVALKFLPGVSAEYYMFYGYVVQLNVFCVIVVRTYNWRDVKNTLFEEKLLHLLRAVTSSATNFLFALAVQTIPATDVTAIFKSTPVYVAVLAHVFLKERIGIYHLVVLGVTLCGVVLVCRPSFLFQTSQENGNHLMGTVYSVLGSICASFFYVTQKKIKRTPVSLSLLANACLCSLIFLPFVLSTGSWFSVTCPQTVYNLLFSSLILASMVLRFQAARLEDASRLSLVVVLDIPYYLVVDIVAFGIYPEWTSYVGSVILVVCLISVVLMKNRHLERSQLTTSVVGEDTGTQM